MAIPTRYVVKAYRELNGIIRHGYSVIIYRNKIIKKATKWLYGW